MELGLAQSFGDMVMFPLGSLRSEGPECLTLSEALENGSLVISEVGDRGQVPQERAAKGRRKYRASSKCQGQRRHGHYLRLTVLFITMKRRGRESSWAATEKAHIAGSERP
mgnify:CR=1 FL=1